MTDSGGFQIASDSRKGKPATVLPRASLRWQERNADIAFNLDVPPVKDSEFEDNLQESLKNYALFAKERENHEMKLYNVLHGNTLHQFEKWLASTRSFDFDGWAIGSGSNIYTKLLAYLVLHEQDASNLHGNIHFFGTSSLTSMLAFAMLSKRFKTPVTFDSTSYLVGARFRKWLMPMSVGKFIDVGRKATDHIEVNPCKCPVCRLCTIEDLYSQTNSATPMLISLHNLYQFIKVNDRINRLVEDEDAFQQYAESSRESKLVLNIDGMLEEYERGGYRGVYNKYGAVLEKKKPTRRASSPSIPSQIVAPSPVLV